MGTQFKYVAFGVALVILSVITYSFHYLIFQDTHHIFIYLLGDIAFVPIEVLLVSMIIHHFLNDMDKRNKLEKLNMIIGSFFSEVGTKLLALISNADPELDSVRKYIIIKNELPDKEFVNIINYLKNYDYNIDIKKVDLDDLRIFMTDKRNFLVLLLENPTMLEHEAFTELLRVVFHLAEELELRDDFSSLPDTDINHLSVDIRRVYGLLAIEWVLYMKYMKSNYPYLFSLSMRTNPFDKDASPIVD
ncbi:MAG: hypothetical protein MIO92_08955 [Methanosarcinaceae archaeon]|nr:hypothetical protein [Methanosarcinaceae archaeon]